MKTQTLVKKFRLSLLNSFGITLDFRTQQFINNEYGLRPIFDYCGAETIVAHLYDWAHDFISSNSANYPDFSGWQYNLAMEVEKLQTMQLKTLIEGVCKRLSIEYVEGV